jgi:hypothetical protein
MVGTRSTKASVVVLSGNLYQQASLNISVLNHFPVNAFRKFHAVSVNVIPTAY